MDRKTREEAAAEAREILLEELKLLKDQSGKAASSTGIPAANLAALAHEMAAIGGLLLKEGGN